VGRVLHANLLDRLYSAGLSTGSRDCWTAADERYRRLVSTTSSRVLSERTSSGVRLCRLCRGCAAADGLACRIQRRHMYHITWITNRTGSAESCVGELSGVVSGESPCRRVQETRIKLSCILLFWSSFA
jgi:hypothetical protein